MAINLTDSEGFEDLEDKGFNLYKIHYSISSPNNMFEYLRSIGDFLLINKEIYLYTEKLKEDIFTFITNIYPNRSDNSFIIDDFIINDDFTPSRIKKWINDIKLSHPVIEVKPKKDPVEIMFDFIEDVEKNLQIQLEKGGD